VEKFLMPVAKGGESTLLLTKLAVGWEMREETRIALVGVESSRQTIESATVAFNQYP
jgi:hypothetical protein